MKKLRFLTNSARALIFIALFVMLLSWWATWRGLGITSADIITERYIIIAILVLGIVFLYYITNKYFKKSKNAIIIYLRNISTKQALGLFIFLISLGYLYDLIFRFNNVNDYYFVAITIIFILIFLFFFIIFLLQRKGESITKFLKENLNYISLGIEKQPKIIKTINLIAYSCFLIYLLASLVTLNFATETTGELIQIQKEVTILGEAASTAIDYNVFVDTGEGTKQFALNEKEITKCDWENIREVTIRHHIFNYRWGSSVVSCE